MVAADSGWWVFECTTNYLDRKCIEEQVGNIGTFYGQFPIFEERLTVCTIYAFVPDFISSLLKTIQYFCKYVIHLFSYYVAFYAKIFNFFNIDIIVCLFMAVFVLDIYFKLFR